MILNGRWASRTKEGRWPHVWGGGLWGRSKQPQTVGPRPPAVGSDLRREMSLGPDCPRIDTAGAVGRGGGRAGAAEGARAPSHGAARARAAPRRCWQFAWRRGERRGGCRAGGVHGCRAIRNSGDGTGQVRGAYASASLWRHVDSYRHRGGNGSSGPSGAPLQCRNRRAQGSSLRAAPRRLSGAYAAAVDACGVLRAAHALFCESVWGTYC